MLRIVGSRERETKERETGREIFKIYDENALIWVNHIFLVLTKRMVPQILKANNLDLLIFMKPR